MVLRVAVVGSGPAGSSAAETLVKAGIETYLFERKLDNAKPCGGAIPLCMVDEFDLPPNIIDRRVRKMKMISPSNVEVNIGSTLTDDEYIGMCRREVLDGFLRDRAVQHGARLINGTVHTLEIPTSESGAYTLHYTEHREDGLVGDNKSLQVDVVIGADG
ncbi:MAG: FAD-dependent monooxygenase, partial [Nodosilinea sp.]